MDAFGDSASLIFDDHIPVSAPSAFDVILDDYVQPGGSIPVKGSGHPREDLLH
jgi:hypothetical protein